MPKGVKHQRESVDFADFSEKVKQLEATNAELRAKLEAATAKDPIPTAADPVPAIKDPVPAPPSPVTEEIERMRGMLGPGVWSVGAEIDHPKYLPNLTSLFGSVPVPDHVLAERERPPTQAEREARKVMGTELPLFSGNPTEWPLFISTYMQTTLAGGYSNRENSVRLKTCLKGAAFEAVSGSLLLPDAVPRVIETLQMLYGRPEILVQALLDKVRAVPAPRAEKLETLCDFALAVRSFSDHLIAAGQRNHLENPVLLMELVAKLPAHVKLSWGHHLTTTQTPANLESLSKFLFEVAQSVAKVTLYKGYTEDYRTAKDRSKNKSLCHAATQPNTMMADNSPEHDSCESNRRVHCPPFAFANSAVRTKGFRSKIYPICPACENEKHPLMTCPVFTRMEVQDRFRVVNEKRLCSNCFRSDHFARSCPSTYTCKHCSKRHHTMIHPGPSQRTEASPSGVNMLAAVTEFPSSALESSPSCYANTLLTTVVLIVIDVYGQEHMARALLDTGSQLNAISERLCQMLHLPRKAADVTIAGVGDNLTQARQKVQTEIRSRLNDFNESIEFLVLNRVSSTPLYSNQFHIPSTFPLADPGFQTSRRIDMIIGGAHFYHFLREGRLRLANRTLLVETVFGWVVTGKMDDHTLPPSRTATCNAVTISSINEQLERFWRLEEISQNNYSVDEQRCEEYYQKTVSRDSTGRYIVRMPKKFDDNPIGHSKPSAQRRFRYLEQKLHKDENLKLQYHQFMSEYASLGHMAPVIAQEENNPGAYYLPHHPVVKESSTTTKVRVVFDGSSKTSSGFSLNDSLLVGPIVQDELITLILRFRKFPIALVGDIEKMYRQILMHPSDRPLQRILWRFDSSHPIQTYELGTVTYGIAPSSFLATRTLLQLAEDEGAPFPKASVALRKHIYVDDLISGEYSIQGAIQLRDELSELLQKGGFRMRKWCSNSLPVLSGLSPELLGTQSSLKFDPEESVKTLGIRWKPEADVFRFDISVTLQEQSPTKRSILSAISQLYDPLGIISPVVVQAKLIMQHIWLLALDWDDEVSSELQRKWAQFCEQLPSLPNIRVERFAFAADYRFAEIHSFADASEAAYGACVYVRSQGADGRIKVSLLTSKSKVAPLKPLSIPRLELCAALLAARLYEKVISSLDMQFSDSFFWSDSTIVLHWMKAPPRTWKTFVANRIAEIQATTHGSHWQHVSGKENPADMISRGSSVEELVCSELWMHGPLWLREDKSSWPSPIITAENIAHEEEERKQEVMLTAQVLEPYLLFERFSSYRLLIVVVAYCLRFSHNARTREHRTRGSYLFVREIQGAKTTLVRIIQAEVFREELQRLKKGHAVPVKSSIRLLSPYIDDAGLIRVGGRLRSSDAPHSVKHPIVLPGFHPYTQLLITHIHEKLIHGGISMTLAVVRDEFWPINGRRAVRSAIRKCYKCARSNPQPIQQPIGQLPAARVTCDAAFSSTGVDYCGPVYLKPVHRKAASRKSYICVFVCLSTKAVHLELSSDLSTSAFLMALDRFTGRCTIPRHIYSDNGTNFIGAKNALHELYNMLQSGPDQKKIAQHLADVNIQWHLISPRAPNFGGLWEAAVKVAKRQLVCQLGSSLCTYEELTTILVKIERAMNSRPLQPLSSDPNDLSVLTPAHFLGRSTTRYLPELDVRDVALNRLGQYQRLQRRAQDFWFRWRNEYLKELNSQYRTNPRIRRMSLGDVVILRDESLPPARWPLARIIELHPGPDGVTRVVTLRTANSVLKRAVCKVCPLDCGINV